MKIKNILIIIIILTVFLNISCIYASDDILGGNIYVDSNTGNDDYSGDTLQTPVKTIKKAIELIPDNSMTNIYLSNGSYNGQYNSQLKLENKNIVNIIGSDNTMIDGENLNRILTVSNVTKLTIQNVQFINARNSNVNSGIVLDIDNNSNVLIDNCSFLDNTKSAIRNGGNLIIIDSTFINNKDRVGDSWNTVRGGAIYNTGTLNISNSIFKENYAGIGGAIYNTGNLSVTSSTFRYNKATNHGSSLIQDTIKNMDDGGRGGDICNYGNAIITNTTFKETALIDLGYRGGSIYNKGNMILKSIEISNIIFTSNDPIGRHSAGTAIANLGNLTLTDSIIANITSHIAYEGRIQGAIHNEGMFTATRSIFENNKVDRLYMHTLYYDIGSGNIYNTGEGILNITSCIFFNNNPNILDTVAQDISIRAGSAVCLENNSWSGEDPLTNYHIYGTLNVTKYWLLSFEPDYYMLDIGEKTNITETLKLMYERHSVDYSQLPDLYVKFNVNGENITRKITDGKASIEFNKSDVKGSYVVTSTISNIVKTAEVDVGKEYSAMEVEAEEISYGDNATFYMTVTGNYTHQPTGTISVIVDGKKYTTNIINSHANLTISGLIPKTYDLIIKYEGDEDYFKAIFHENYTVHKKATNMSIIIPEVYYGEAGLIKVTISPEKVSNQAYLYITDENNETIRKVVFVRNGTELKLKNYASGEYNVLLVLWDHKYYIPSNATAIFKVKKYETNLTINASDINAGEMEFLNITLSPKGEVAGEAILQINNLTQQIFLKNGENTIKIENLTGGIYHVSVTFPGDKKYAPSNATAIFTVKKIQTNISVKLENNILYINTTPNSTGKVLIYINNDIYEVNLTNSQITFPTNFTKAENNIFIYYQGDGYYNYTTYELSYENEELLNLTAYDIVFYDNENGTYYVTLTDEEGYGIANKTITLTLNNKKYTVVTGDDGSAELIINLTTGEYAITAQYRNKTATNKITVLKDAVLRGNDTKAYENIDFTYSVKLTNQNGKAIENEIITFEIDGKTYTNKTNSNGIVRITLNLSKGNYTITSRYKNSANMNNLEIIEDHMLIGQNIRAYENTDFTYTITLTKVDKTPITNQTITFIINNRRYTDITDSQGKAGKTLNLPEGNYTITAIYKSTRISNELTIIQDYTLEGNNVRAYSEKDFQYNVILTDHNNQTVKNAEITFTIADKTYKNITDSNGHATITLNLKKGNYTITASYKDVKTTNRLEIIDTYQLNGNNVKSYENFDFEYIATLTNHNSKTISGQKITFTVDGKTYTNTTDNNSQAKLTLNLKKGNYTITATYNNVKTTNYLEIIEYDLEKIESSDIEMYYNDGTRFKIRLIDNNNSPLVNRTVQITINSNTYTRTTNNNGTATIPLKLNSGKYNVTTKYGNLEKANIVTIKSTVSGKDIVKIYRNATQYQATFLDSNGNYLTKGTQVRFNINGVEYKRNISTNGVARLNLNLEQGNYTITATNPVTGENVANNIEIQPQIIQNNDIEMYYHDGSQYSVKLLTKEGKTAPKGTAVIFNINGVFYTRTTNENGTAKLNLKLQPGTYTITAEYEGCRVSNIIKIKTILKADNLNMKYQDGSQFKATLLNGQGNPYANRQIIFNINGVHYTRTTNDNGTAKLNIKLQRGTYIITSSYDGTSISNTIIIS